MGDLEYVYAVARVRVREKNLLSDADIAQLCGMKSEQEVMAFLADRGWGDQSAQQDAEKMLNLEDEKTMAFIKELHLDENAFDLLEYKELYHNLKAGIKEMVSPDDNVEAFFRIEGFEREKVLKILEEKDYNSLPSHMRAAAERAYDVMLKTHDGQLCDVIIDRACLDAIEADGKKSKNALMREYTKSTVTVSNIRIAVRAVRTGKNLSFLREALAACAGVNVRLLAQAAAEGEESLMTFLKEHGFAEAAEALEDSASAFDRWCDNRLIDSIRPQKTNPFSMGPIIAYYLARQNEIKTVRMIITAKANGFSEEAIRERVRKMYV